MGNGFNFLPFMNFCASWNSFMPFMGNAIWGATQQTGYFPMWSAPQWGPDYNFTLPYSKENASAYTRAPEKVPETEEEYIEQQLKRQEESGFKQLKEDLVRYKQTITDTTEHARLEYRINNAKTLADLKKIYDDNKTKIDNWALESSKEKITKINDEELQSTVNSISNTLKAQSSVAGQNATVDFDSILSEGEWKDDVDILNFISTWNTHLTGSNKKHIMEAMSSAYSTLSDNTEKGKVLGLADAMHNKMISEAGELYRSVKLDNLSGAEKEGLTTLRTELNAAKTSLESFNNLTVKFNDRNYSQAFDELYRIMRIVEAKNEELQLKVAGNLPDGATLMTEVETDLKSEGVKKAEAKPPVQQAGAGAGDGDGGVEEGDPVVVGAGDGAGAVVVDAADVVDGDAPAVVGAGTGAGAPVVVVAVEESFKTGWRSQGYSELAGFEGIWKHNSGTYYSVNDNNQLQELVGVTDVKKGENGTIICSYKGGETKTLDGAKEFMNGKILTECNGVYKDSENKFYYIENNKWVEITNCVHVTADGKCYSNWDGEGNNSNIQIGSYKDGKYSIEQKDRTNVRGSQYVNGRNIGVELWNSAHAVAHERFKKILHDTEKVNKESIVGIFAWDFDNQAKGNKSLIKYMSEDFDKNNTNRLVKALMRKAYSLGLQDKDSYKNLVEFFSAVGTPAYKEDGYTPSKDDSFSFNLNTGSVKYQYGTCDKINSMVKALYDDIIALAS